MRRTPGPWHLSPKDSKTLTEYKVYGTNEDLEWVVTVKEDKMLFHGEQDVYANAKLISAAPDLLEALRLLVENVKSLDDIKDLPVMKILLDKSDAAIKKATT